VFVEDINHPVAETPKQEQRSNQHKGDGKILAVSGAK
jgi:hypothetical protein